MTFKARPNTFCIELAASSRSVCRGCRSAVAKGAARLRITAPVRPGRKTAFFRCCSAACLADGRLAAAIASAHRGVERLPCARSVPEPVASAVRAQLEAAARRCTPSAEPVREANTTSGWFSGGWACKKVEGA
jgi:hypothetical protein